MSNYNGLLEKLRADTEKVVSSDRMRATSMVADKIYALKAFLPGKPEVYYLAKFIGSGHVNAQGNNVLVSENIKLNKMDDTDRYFVEIWDETTEEFVAYSANYANKFLNLDLPGLGIRFVTFRRINDSYYEESDTSYNNTSSSKKTSDDIFWEKQREEWNRTHPNRVPERILFKVKCDTEDQLEQMINWRNDQLSIDYDNLLIVYPFGLDNTFNTVTMVKKMRSLGFSWESIYPAMHLTGEVKYWEQKLEREA